MADAPGAGEALSSVDGAGQSRTTPPARWPELRDSPEKGRAHVNGAGVAIALLVASLALLPSVRAGPDPGRITMATVVLEGNPITVPAAPPHRPTPGTYNLSNFRGPHMNEGVDVAFLASPPRQVSHRSPASSL